jgi:hemerythrin
MPQFNWDARYSVNIKRFDEDHQELFRILNTLHDAMMTGRGQAVMQNVLGELLQYTQGHFSREEAAMRKAGYPKLQAHIEQHRRFVHKVQEVSAKFQGGTLGMTIDMLDFLTDWLKKHIVGVDQQYGEFLNARGIA